MARNETHSALPEAPDSGGPSMALGGLVTEAWSYAPNSGSERIEYDLLNLCFHVVGDCLVGNGKKATELCGASLSLKVSGAAHLVTVGQRTLKGVSVDIPPNWIARFDLPELSRAACLGLRNPELMNLGYRLYRESLRSDDLSPLAIEALVLELLVALVRRNRVTKPISPGWVKCIQEFIRSDLTVSPSLEELARLVGYHPVHVARSFRSFTGMTIGEYVRWQRVERAHQLLSDPNLTLAQVAQLAGFSDQSHLTRLFRRCLNLTPKQLRESGRRALHA
jgi:AraC family transcriptional regulator